MEDGIEDRVDFHDWIEDRVNFHGTDSGSTCSPKKLKPMGVVEEYVVATVGND